MDELDLTSPPHKRRQVFAVAPSPPRLSDMLVAFGATKSPTSISKQANMNRQVPGHGLRNKRKVTSYADSEESNSPASAKSESSFPWSPKASPVSTVNDGDRNTVDDGPQSDGEVIVVAPRKGTRELPARSTRSQVNFATPLQKRKTAKPGKRGLSRLLTSDTVKGNSTPIAETARNKVRQAILKNTKPKRDAFFLKHQNYFLPLLPKTSYVHKLAEHGAISQSESFQYQTLAEQPKGVMANMKPYQLEGLSFLVYMFKNGMSCILGDEMGLGKTLQTLSLFQYLAESEPATGENQPHLVVCPLSVLSSWMNESHRWVPNLNVVRFHGPKAERDRLKKELLGSLSVGSGKTRVAGDKTVDIVVTTYETFRGEQTWLKRAFAWRYCVLDEGHKVKNDKSDISSALQSLQAEYRLLLTGTPLQNNLHEMWALLHWLYPDVFPSETADMFKKAFDLTKGNVSTKFMDEARLLLELVMLRRMKSSPGVNLDLPPKDEILLYVPLTPMQRFWYTRLITRADNLMLEELFKGARTKEIQSWQQQADDDKQLTLFEKGAAAAEALEAHGSGDDVWAESRQIMEQVTNNTDEADTKGGDWRKLMNLIMQLRKVCSHPYLIKGASPEPYYLGEHVMTASGKFIVLDKLVNKLVLEKKKKVLIFSGFTQTLNLVEDLLALKGGNAPVASFRYLRLDGSTARARRNLGIRMFNDPESECKVMLISTRAGGLGINLASASDVIFLDEDWNPQITLQAEARAHRIGQVNPVTIYKLCTQGTVEEQMMGRIRKKLYLSAKITESMRNIHSAKQQGNKKRKRTSNENSIDDDAPQLDTSQLKSLLRRGAQTLARPEVDVTAMLGWDYETTLDKCKDRADDPHVADQTGEATAENDEQEWLNSMEKVETAVFEGKTHHRQLDKEMKQVEEMTRADRRIGKNTTVMINGFAISKESMQCADWEAVPTFAGKDPRLAEPAKIKKDKIVNQEHCQVCWDGGSMVCCSGCPRSFHITCLPKEFKGRAKSAMQFYCPQHECIDCGSKTTEAGGLIYRCRWCHNGYCEDCLDWETVALVGETLPEYELLGFPAVSQAWYIDCPACVERGKTDEDDFERIESERKKIDLQYDMFLSAPERGDAIFTPATVSEVATPDGCATPPPKRTKLS